MEIGNFPGKKKIQNNYSEDDPGSQKENGEDARNVYQRPRRTKEQTEMNYTLEGIHSRITNTEEQIWKTEWSKSLPQNRI